MQPAQRRQVGERRGHAAARFAGRFRLVKCGVGNGEQVDEIHAVTRRHGDADADADIGGGAVVEIVGTGNRADQLFAERERAFFAQVVRQHDEFVAADARRHIGGAQHALQALGGHPEQLIARGVAVGVVHRLEAVEIEKQQRQSFVAWPRP